MYYDSLTAVSQPEFDLLDNKPKCESGCSGLGLFGPGME